MVVTEVWSPTNVIPGAASPIYRRLDLQTSDGPAKYWGDVNENEQPHGQGVTRWERSSHEHCGMYADGLMHGAGTYFIPADEALYEIDFVKGNPCGMGTLSEGSGRRKDLYEVDFDGKGSFSNGVQPVKKIKSRRTDPKEALLPVCGMLAGPKGGPLGYDHCEPVSGELIWARPPRCDCMLFNAEECKGKVVIARRGGTDFNRKLLVVQEAGAVGLVVVGWDDKEEKYMRPICSLTTGPMDGPDLPSHLRELEVKIPVVYMLKKLENGLHEGASSFLHFDAKSPPGWKGGAVYIKPAEKKLRNSEGEAQAQWDEKDLTFGKEKTMMGSNGRIIKLDEKDRAAPPKQLKSQLLTTSTKSRRDCKVLIGGTEFTMYHFRLSFGDLVWEIMKRYSDFDTLDEELNTKYGLPPAGLPPKKWFGLSNPELIRNRHEVLNVYLNDCVKRPVLVLSPELQAFCEMPEEVLGQLKKGG